MKFFVRPIWRWLLRFRRISYCSNRLGLPGFIKFAFIDLILNPVFRRFRLGHPRVRVKVPGYSGPFVIRLATTDLDCFLEVILEEEYVTALRLAKKDCKVVFDAGSNVGFSLRYFQKAFPSALIIGVEPDKENLSVCRENVSYAENPEHIKLFGCCVAARPGKVRLDRSGGAWAIQMRPAGLDDAENQIEARTVDHLLNEAGAGERTVDIFKCDIEGAEAELFREPGAWLERSECLAIETHAPYYDICLMDDLRRFSSDFEFVRENEVVFARRPADC